MQVVRAGREAVVAAERWKRADPAPFPHDAPAREARVVRAGKEIAAAPGFAERLRRVGLRDAGDEPDVILDRPRHIAVRTAERAEVDHESARPQRRVTARVPGEAREAGDPAFVVDAVASM